MRHARPAALAQLEPLLAELRSLRGLVEKGRGVFYRKGRAFLHFHEDPSGLFADVRDEAGVEFDRLNVRDQPGRARLIAVARERAG